MGGGTTTDMQWSLSYRDGRYVRIWGDGVQVHEDLVEESYLLDVLRSRRYRWVRFSPPPRAAAPSRAP